MIEILNNKINNHKVKVNNLTDINCRHTSESWYPEPLVNENIIQRFHLGLTQWLSLDQISEHFSVS